MCGQDVAEHPAPSGLACRLAAPSSCPGRGLAGPVPSQPVCGWPSSFLSSGLGLGDRAPGSRQGRVPGVPAQPSL